VCHRCNAGGDPMTGTDMIRATVSDGRVGAMLHHVEALAQLVAAEEAELRQGASTVSSVTLAVLDRYSELRARAVHPSGS